MRWQRPLGTLRLGSFGLHTPASWGAPHNAGGGALVTASGLIFIGAPPDRKFRALSLWTGEVLWESRLPYPGAATPMSFKSASDRQLVVIAAGGRQIDDALVAFALPAP